MDYELIFYTQKHIASRMITELKEFPWSKNIVFLSTDNLSDLPLLPTSRKRILICDSDRRLLKSLWYSLPMIALSHEDNTGESLMGCPWMIDSSLSLDLDFLDLVWHRHYGIPMLILKTERCLLRELTLSDCADLLQLQEENASDPSGCFFPEGTTDPENYLDQYIHCQYPFFEWGVYGIALNHSDSDKIIGIAGFTEAPKPLRTDNLLEVGYCLKKEWQNRGILSEILPELIGYANEHWTNSKLICVTRKTNQPSVKLARKCGLDLVLL